MARVNTSIAPYYDDYDSSKQYTQLLAIPGRVAQAREFTQMQTTIKDIVRSIGDSIFKDGNIVEGCQVIVNSSKTEVTVTSGKVYIDGLVLPVAESTVTIKGVGTETIGAKLMETLITESDDASLRDPAQGYDNFNRPGCHRIRSWISIVVDDPDSAIIATLVDGAVTVEKYAPDYDSLTQVLARRTYDESGSYLVNGLKVRVEAHPTDDSKFVVVIESGKAYVLGYELKVPAPRRLNLPRATTYDKVTANNYWYNPSISNYTLASAPYVKSITSVKGFVSKTVTQTISYNEAQVLLDELEVSQITSVTQGNESYTIGTSTTGDCYLYREGTRYYLKWNGTDHYPELNASYSVTYTYHHTFIQGTDYELSHDTATDNHNIKWLEGGMTPLTNANFTVVYDQYLARKDIIYIDRYGNISYVLGNPAENGFEVIPSAPINTLALAEISSPPGGLVTDNINLKITVNNIGLTRFTMYDIQSMLNRMRTIEYDQAVLALNDEAKQYETTSTKRGIFTEPLLDLSKLDYYYNLSEGVRLDPSKPVYDAAIDLDNNICYLPIKSKSYDAIYDVDNSTVHKYSRVVTLAKTGERTVLSQNKATGVFLINPYSVYPHQPEISLDPAVDTWIDENKITVNVSRTTTEVVGSSTRHTERSFTSSNARSSWQEITSKLTNIGTRTETTTEDSVLSETAATYIRQREVTVEGHNFPPNLNNIKCYFDGVEASLTPTGSTSAGTIPGSVKASPTGDITAKFTIPANILTGVREVRLASDITIAGYLSSAFALYEASGTNRTVQSTVTTLTTVLQENVTTVTTVNDLDPIGQTFLLDKMTLVSGINVYLENKPSENLPLTCEIREVVNGSITSTIYGHKTLYANDIQVSSDSRVATRFSFEDPVLLEENREYAFVLRTPSTEYRAWIAELGEKDIISGDTVLLNPYLVGIMLSSSNNSSWSMHQNTDIKFDLIADNYSNSSDLLFNEIEGTAEFSRIYLLAENSIPEGTSLQWYYSTDSGTSFSDITPYNITSLSQMKNKILLKAKLSKNNSTNLSPIIALDSVGAVLSSYDTEGYYISKNITNLDNYTHVDIIVDTYIPSNTSIKIYVSTDDGDTMTQATASPTVVNRNYGWKEQTYTATVTSATQCRVFIKFESDYEYFTPAFRRLRVIMS